MSAEVLRAAILSVPSEKGKTRKWTATTLTALARFAELEFYGSPYRGTDGVRAVDPRSLPTDDEIIEAWQKIEYSEHQMIFALMATFGLRNHKAYLLNPETFAGSLVDVKGGKTGERIT
ncbi:MAG: hypothetical protein AAGG02_13290 [Cyanobacteria bacterium P01_H01_bin.15]